LSLIRKSILSLFIFFLAAIFSSGCDFGPHHPEVVIATPISPSQIHLSWYQPRDPDDYERTCTLVYRNGVEVADVEVSTEYLDEHLESASVYCYRTRSYYCSEFTHPGKSRSSNETCVMTYPLSSISGRVMLGESGLEDILVTINAVTSGGWLVGALTDAEGRYLFQDLDNGGYVVTPTDPTFNFAPISHPVVILNDDVPDQDFQAVVGSQ